jgi:glycosyltransferase involved in cell wall biosynthesis
VPGYLAAADILVSPHAPVAGFIGSPIKIFEYMASGRAIVASRLAQIAEILEHEHTALLTEPGSAADLCEALRRLVDDSSLRARLGAAARDQARSRHTWDSRLDDALRFDGEAGLRDAGAAH